MRQSEQSMRCHKEQWLKRAFIVMSLMSLLACRSDWQAPLDSSYIDGQVVQSRGAVVSSARRVARPSISSSSYTVKSGDTLVSIAFRADTDYKQLASWNNISNPYVIYPGQKLTLTPSKYKHKVKPSRPAKKTTTKKKTQTTVSASSIKWSWPAKGKIVAKYNPSKQQKGIKIAGKIGDEVLSTERGKVVYAGSGLIGYGRLIIVKHNDSFLSAYGHNNQLLVKKGDQVRKGQKIALMGEAKVGKPLVHFEIRKGGKPVNPLSLLPKR